MATKYASIWHWPVVRALQVLGYEKGEILQGVIALQQKSMCITAPNVLDEIQKMREATELSGAFTSLTLESQHPHKESNKVTMQLSVFSLPDHIKSGNSLFFNMPFKKRRTGQYYSECVTYYNVSFSFSNVRGK